MTMKKVNHFLTEQQIARLESASETTGLTVAELIRRAIDIASLERLTVVIPDAILKPLGTAVAGGSYMTAVWSVHNGKIKLDRTTMNFPRDDLPKALGLLSRDLKAK